MAAINSNATLRSAYSENRGPQKIGCVWPETLLTKQPVRTTLICEAKSNRSSADPVVSFPRLEIPLSGVYQTRCLRDGAVQDFSLQPGTALFVPPGGWSSPIWRRNVRILCLQFEQKCLTVNITLVRRKRRSQFTKRTFAFATPMAGPIPHILRAMLERESTGEDPEVLSALTRAMIHCVGALVSPRPVKSCRCALFESVCAYLEQNYHQDITRDSVARLFRVNPSHLSRLFGTCGQIRFVDYLTKVRLNQGKYLLRTQRFKLEDIASRVGICDAAYFCKLFKKSMQTTPTEYRARVLQLPPSPKGESYLRDPSIVQKPSINASIE